MCMSLLENESHLANSHIFSILCHCGIYWFMWKKCANGDGSRDYLSIDFLSYFIKDEIMHTKLVTKGPLKYCKTDSDQHADVFWIFLLIFYL